MSYDVKVISDSVAPHGSRITTIQATFPRFILAEVNTHRMLSRNSASSRAIPPEKIIQRVQDHPFVPETFGKRVKGMGVGDAIVGEDSEKAKQAWLNARDKAVQAALVLVEIDCDKSRINRLLEPFLWHTALITATEWDNFFALRDHKDAQPEFQIIARMMREAMEASSPQELAYGHWHLPYVREDELEVICHADSVDVRKEWAHVSAGRCFTVSYDKLDEIMNEDPMKSRQRSTSGSMRGHWSPLEHPAMATPDMGPIANFYGWQQLRKMYPMEDNFQKVIGAESIGAPMPKGAPSLA